MLFLQRNRKYNAVRLTLGFILLIFFFLFLYNRILPESFVGKNSISGFDTNYTENEFSLTSNIDSISKIRNQESWEPLSTEKKLSVLQDIVNCDTNYWGMEKLTVKIKNFPEHILGSYRDDKRSIYIDKEHLENDSPEDILKTILHEVYHGWQHDLVRLYLDSSDSQRKLRVFQNCAEYYQEMKHYEDGREDCESYMAQQLERDCCVYAENEFRVYYDEIDLILAEQEAEREASFGLHRRRNRLKYRILTH